MKKNQNQARLAQSVEHETLNLRVVGSSPTLGDFFRFCSFSNEYFIYTLYLDNIKLED